MAIPKFKLNRNSSFFKAQQSRNATREFLGPELVKDPMKLKLAGRGGRGGSSDPMQSPSQLHERLASALKGRGQSAGGNAPVPTNKPIPKADGPHPAPARGSNISDRDSYLATKQANKLRGRQESVRRAKERDAGIAQSAKSRLTQGKHVAGTGTVSSAETDAFERMNAEFDLKTVTKRQRKYGDIPKTSGGSGSPVSSSGQGTTAPATKGVKANTPKDSGRINLKPGGAAGENPNLTSQITGTAKMMGDNIAEHVGAKYGGNYGAFLGKSALQGAVWGGAVGGTVSAAQGGDFWAGAKEGAFKGAVGMAGWNTLRAGTKTKGMFDVGTMSHNAQQMWKHHGASKPVTAITRTAPTMQVANQMVNQ